MAAKPMGYLVTLRAPPFQPAKAAAPEWHRGARVIVGTAGELRIFLPPAGGGPEIIHAQGTWLSVRWGQKP